MKRFTEKTHTESLLTEYARNVSSQNTKFYQSWLASSVDGDEIGPLEDKNKLSDDSLIVKFL